MPRKWKLDEVGGHRGDTLELADGRTAKVLEFRPGYFSTHALVEFPDGEREVIRTAGLYLVAKGPMWKEKKE